MVALPMSITTTWLAAHFSAAAIAETRSVKGSQDPPPPSSSIWFAAINQQRRIGNSDSPATDATNEIPIVTKHC